MRIDKENQAMAIRMMTKPGTLSIKKLEKDY